MDIQKAMNGVASHLYERDKVMFTAIAKELNVSVDRVRKAAYAASEKEKYKPIKHQAKATKNPSSKDKEKRSPNGYNMFAEDIRQTVIKNLIEIPKEREFLNKEGELQKIDPSTFANGVPNFAHITKKSASLWHFLPQEEKDVYIKRAKDKKLEASMAIPIKEDESSESAECVVASESSSSDEPEIIMPPPKRGNGVRPK
jgi:hypothetical protein